MDILNSASTLATVIHVDQSFVLYVIAGLFWQVALPVLGLAVIIGVPLKYWDK